MTVATGAAATPTPSIDDVIRRDAIICIVGLCGFLLWAGFAPLEEGIAVRGAVVVAEDRKVVQHLEGGIIDELLVGEGDIVAEGEPLIVLRRTASQTERDRILYQMATLEGALARQEAVQGDKDAPDFAAVSALKAPADLVDRVIAEQTALFAQDRKAHETELAILKTRADSARATASARIAQGAASRRALASAQKQLTLTREMFDARLARADQVQGLEQQVAGLQADVVRLENERAEAAANAIDLDGQIERARIARQQKAGEEALKARAELTDRQESLGAAEDILNRTTIVAPRDGEVLNLAVKTIGGVIRASETIMEIVPESGALTASVRVRPVDRGSVYRGQRVRTKLVAYKSWKTPQITGEVVSLSADLKRDAATGEEYYEARIAIPDKEAARLKDKAISPGMPVEAFIFSGSSRTLIDYLFEPITESLFKGVRSS